MSESAQLSHRSRLRLRHYALAAALAWTAFIAASLGWSVFEHRRGLLFEARYDAQISFQKEILFRFWSDNHSGFAPARNNAPPSHDVARAEKGSPVIPEPMLRKILEQSPGLAGYRSHLASLKPKWPENAADAWEAVALQSFANGETEVASVATMDGQEYMRVMRPLVNEASCLPCHSAQDFKVGEIRGGMSVSVPMAPRWAHAQSESIALVIVEGAIWVLGLGVIGIGARRIQAHNRERASAETVLQQSEERYRLFFENNPLLMWLYDLETLRFLAVNEAAVQHYGYTREEYLAMTIKQIRPEEDIPALLKSVAEELPGSKSTSEWRHRRKDGTIIHVEIISSPMVFAGRACRLVVASDITEKKLIEKKFLHAQQLESIGMLAAGIAHDLNNVFAPILFVAPLLRQSLSAPRDLKILSTLEQSAGRGVGLVKQILGFAHANTSEPQPTQVKHLARDVISVIEETFPKSIELQQQIPSDLWLVQGNPTQIHQVLLNLCVNARDAMPQGGMLRITAANRRLDAAEASMIPGARPGAWVVLEVGDTGTGIPPEALARIWEPFFTTKGAGKGTGLGLATVRGIVFSHHGFVELHTEVGHGTTFRVFLPAVESAALRPVTAAPFDIPEGRGELVLVVDDEAFICDLVGTILENHGYRTVSCGDGVEAITLFATRPDEISLVITDVDMPRLGGVALARALLRLYPDIRLLGMSGLSRTQTDNTDLPEMQELTQAFLLKPFKAEALLSAVHRLLHPGENP